MARRRRSVDTAPLVELHPQDVKLRAEKRLVRGEPRQTARDVSREVAAFIVVIGFVVALWMWLEYAINQFHPLP